MILRTILKNKPSKKPLSYFELVAIALGGMVGGGIFSILGISVEKISNLTPVAILIGGILAFFAAYSYTKLATYYKDEGATYSFFKKTFPQSAYAATAIGWLIAFGYISTLALYAFTFSSYLGSLFPSVHDDLIQKIIAGTIILFFAIVNLTSVKGMGKIEDLLVYTKMMILLIISGVFIAKGQPAHMQPFFDSDVSLSSIFIVSAITFVAYEGFQLVIHAYEEADQPDKNIPRAIYTAIFVATAAYILLSIGALLTLPKELIIKDKEFALASGANSILGNGGLFVVIFGALLATSSAISGTLFGASRLMAVIASNGHLPQILATRIKGHIPKYSIITMSVAAFFFILTGGLETILEFGSITFIVVSLLMAYSNFKIRNKTHTKTLPALIAIVLLLAALLLIFYYEIQHDPVQFLWILSLYAALLIGAWFYSKYKSQ